MKGNSIDRITGALFGVAVGDALGAPLEFMDAAAIEKQHGYVTDMIGGGWLNVAPGEVTDDTQMTLAVAEGIAENPDAPIEAIGRNFVAWLLSRPKDIGGTCLSSIESATIFAANRLSPSEADWRYAAARTDQLTGGRSGGNGSLMRTVYVGLYYADEEVAAKHARRISEMTHQDSAASDACELYTRMICRMIDEPDEAVRQQTMIDTLKALARKGARYEFKAITRPGFRPSPTGYVEDSFAAALYCILKTNCFKDAVAKAANLGGDADTIAAITGGLAGALYGFENIPVEWVDELDVWTASRLRQLASVAEKAQHEGE